MILSKKEFVFDKIKAKVFFNDVKCFILMHNNIRIENVSKPILDENGNEMFNIDENNVKTPIKHFVETKMCFPYFQDVIVSEETLELIKKSNDKVENLEDFLTPYEVK